MPLDRLLVVTFGRAASQELRSRVRERLVDAERSLEAAAAGDPVRRRRRRAAAPARRCAEPEELRCRRDRARRALTDFDAATIATIHQFCQLVLRSLGVAGDTDAARRAGRGPARTCASRSSTTSTSPAFADRRTMRRR